MWEPWDHSPGKANIIKCVGKHAYSIILLNKVLRIRFLNFAASGENNVLFYLENNLVEMTLSRDLENAHVQLFF